MEEAIAGMVFEAKYCTGCRACELACSFHHKKVFKPSIASIEITGKEKTHKDKIFEIRLYGKHHNDHFACDDCKGLEEKNCLRYCHEDAKEELRSFLKTMSNHF
jgi:Fe-S-cluster-containing hydrogenase component 2